MKIAVTGYVGLSITALQSVQYRQQPTRKPSRLCNHTARRTLAFRRFATRLRL